MDVKDVAARNTPCYANEDLADKTGVYGRIENMVHRVQDEEEGRLLQDRLH